MIVMRTDFFLIHYFLIKRIETFMRNGQKIAVRDARTRFSLLKRRNKIIGFIACKILKVPSQILGRRIALLDFGVVDKHFQRLGTGYALLVTALGWCSERADIVECGVRVDNYSSLSMTQKVGLKIISSSFTLHKWL